MLPDLSLSSSRKTFSRCSHCSSGGTITGRQQSHSRRCDGPEFDRRSRAFSFDSPDSTRNVCHSSNVTLPSLFASSLANICRSSSSLSLPSLSVSAAIWIVIFFISVPRRLAERHCAASPLLQRAAAVATPHEATASEPAPIARSVWLPAADDVLRAARGCESRHGERRSSSAGVVACRATRRPTRARDMSASRSGESTG
mmetsp:Transcript_19965/g.40682  ORF Transcript_19965/g.40682 Transcript_19965/m.40682 type:complete len:200 (-) Transcript_19965:2-601(-)